jgi:hypothetical protein
MNRPDLGHDEGVMPFLHREANMHLRTLGLVLALCLGIPSGGHAQGLSSFSPDEVRRMRRGEVLVDLRDTRESTLKDVRTVGIVPDDPDRVWDVLLDFDSYTRIFKGILKTEVRAVTPDYQDHYSLLDYPWPFEDRWTVNRITMSADRRRFNIRHIDGTVREVVGGWTLEPLERGTLITYQVRVDPGLGFLPAWAIDWGTRQAAPEIIQSVRRELDRKR